jgi:hypothetical protein
MIICCVSTQLWQHGISISMMVVNHALFNQKLLCSVCNFPSAGYLKHSVIIFLTRREKVKFLDEFGKFDELFVLHPSNLSGHCHSAKKGLLGLTSNLL